MFLVTLENHPRRVFFHDPIYTVFLLRLTFTEVALAFLRYYFVRINKCEYKS